MSDGRSANRMHRRAGGRIRGGVGFFMSGSWVFANLPNLITLARLLLTPMAVTMIVSQRFVAAFLIFVAAGVSDAVDGFIARRFDLRSELGSYLDPLADKALVNLDVHRVGDDRRRVAGAGDPRRLARPDDPLRRAGFLAARQAGGDPARSGSRSSTPSPRSPSPRWCSAPAPSATTTSAVSDSRWPGWSPPRRWRPAGSISPNGSIT